VEKTKTAIEVAQRVAERHASELAAIRRADTRTEDWKRREIAKVYIAMREERDEEVERSRRRLAAERQRLEDRVFGVDGLPGDKASLAISRRDAGDRAARLENPMRALDLLARADRSGDEPLARAIAEVAYERDWAEVANRFADSRPAMQRPLEELWNTEEPRTGGMARIGEEMARSVIKPEELQGMSDFEIDRLAQSEHDEPSPAQAARRGGG
jgi:hypothetical protein